MSALTKGKNRLSTTEIRVRKNETPLVCLTAYSKPMAQFLDPHCDILLVGDSLGMVVYGLESTLAVSVDMMINHGKAVMRGSTNACVIVDLPFGSYQKSPEQAFETAARIMAETGCAAIKLEGGAEMAPTVAFLVARGIPVMGHVGLMPQKIHTLGGFKSQGRDHSSAETILHDAREIAGAGAFSIVIEGTVEPVARQITETLDIPTIGIGASNACDGQVLVAEDILGLFSDFTPKFVKRYADLGQLATEAAQQYAADVRARTFPAKEHCFGLPAGAKSGETKT